MGDFFFISPFSDTRKLFGLIHQSTRDRFEYCTRFPSPNICWIQRTNNVIDYTWRRCISYPDWTLATTHLPVTTVDEMSSATTSIRHLLWKTVSFTSRSIQTADCCYLCAEVYWSKNRAAVIDWVIRNNNCESLHRLSPYESLTARVMYPKYKIRHTREFRQSTRNSPKKVDLF
jgi:hypothetical protein